MEFERLFIYQITLKAINTVCHCQCCCGMESTGVRVTFKIAFLMWMAS